MELSVFHPSPRGPPEWFSIQTLRLHHLRPKLPKASPENGCLRRFYADFLDWSRLHFINLHFSFRGSVALDGDVVPI